MDLRIVNHRLRKSREQAAQIAIALLADTAEFVLAATGTLPRHKTDPSREIASRSEGPWITNTGDQSGGEGWTDARDIVKPLTGRVRSVPSHDLAVEREDLGLQHLKLGTKGGNAPTRYAGQPSVTAISNDSE